MDGLPYRRPISPGNKLLSQYRRGESVLLDEEVVDQKLNIIINCNLLEGGDVAFLFCALKS